MRVRPSRAASATAIAAAAAFVVSAGIFTAGAASASSFPPDPDSVGSLTFYNSAGQAITSGSVNDSPIAAYVEGSASTLTGATKATLFGYLRTTINLAGSEAGQQKAVWQGEALGSSTSFPVTGAPAGLSGAGTLPVETGAAGDFSIADLEAAYPNTDTSDDGFAGVYELRLVSSAPGEVSTTYDSAYIEVDQSAGTWQVITTPPGGSGGSGTTPPPPSYSTYSTSTSVTWPASLTYGSGYAVGVSVTSSGGTPTGTVVLSYGSTVLGAANLSGGGATIPVSAATSTEVPAGAGRTLQVTYEGAAQTASANGFSSSAASRTYTENKATFKTSLKYSPAHVGYFQHGVATVTIGSIATATGKVEILNGKKVLAAGTAKAGKANITLPILKRGTYKLQARYLGNADLNASTSSVAKLTILAKGTASESLKVSPARVAYTKRASAVVKVSGPRSTNGKVQILKNGRVVASGTVKGGKATIKLPRITKLGTYNIQVKYEGNAYYYAGTSSAVTLTVVK